MQDGRPGSSPWHAAGLTFACVFPSTAAWLYFVTFAEAPFMPALYAACKIVQFAFPVAWVLLMGPRGRPGPTGPRSLVPGVLSGLAAVGIMGGGYLTLIQGSDLAQQASARIADRIVAMGAATPARFLGMTLLLSIVHSFLEEYYWRWFVYAGLRVRRGALGAGMISSVAFAAHHVIVLHAFIGSGRYWWMTVVLSFAVAIGGGIWAWIYERSGSLLTPWISHAFVDLGIFAIGYHLSWRLLQA